MNTNTISNITHTFTITIDETKMVEELTIEGKYNWSNSYITSENFPRPEDGTKAEKNIVLFHFEKEMTSEQVIAEMEKEGYRPATTHELLALGIAEPKLQSEFPIIALGSVCVLCGGGRVALLNGCVSKRGLDLDGFDCDWGDCRRFAGAKL